MSPECQPLKRRPASWLIHHKISAAKVSQSSSSKLFRLLKLAWCQPQKNIMNDKNCSEISKKTPSRHHVTTACESASTQDMLASNADIWTSSVDLTSLTSLTAHESTSHGGQWTSGVLVPFEEVTLRHHVIPAVSCLLAKDLNLKRSHILYS